MGISIAYSGKLRAPTLVPELIGDLSGKASDAGWPIKTMKELLAEGIVTCSGLEGISIYPHRECEPLRLHFDPEGALVNHTYYALLSDTKMARMMLEAMAESSALTRGLAQGSPEKAVQSGGLHVSIGIPEMPEAPGVDFFKEGSRYNWTKTQFAGPKVHVAVCATLRYIKERYAPDLTIKDDSGYFVDGDYAKLEGQFAYIEHITSLTARAVGVAAGSAKSPMTLDAFVDRINEELADWKNQQH